MKKYFEILKKCPLFFGIDEADLEKMLTCLGAKIETYGKKFTVFPEGIPVKHIGIVLSGSVQVIQIDYFGNRNILGTFESSQIFAEAFACAETKSIPVSIIANEESEIMLLDASHILYTCSNGCSFHHQLIFNLMRDLANKTIMFHQRIEITSKRTTREKLLSFLASEAKRQNKNEFDIAYDRQELSDYLEVERSGLSAEISKLRNEGIIENNKRHFKLL